MTDEEYGELRAVVIEKFQKMPEYESFMKDTRWKMKAMQRARTEPDLYESGYEKRTLWWWRW